VNSFFSLRLVDGLRQLRGEADEVVFVSSPPFRRPEVRLLGATPALLEALGELQAGGVTDTLLFGAVLGREGKAGLSALRRWLARLDALGAIERTLVLDEEPLVTLRPLAPAFEAPAVAFVPDQAYVLSRFASCRNDRGRLVVETPLGHAELQIHAPEVLRALAGLAQPSTAEALAARVGGLDGSCAAKLIELLRRARMVVATTPGNAVPEDADPALGRWAFHDLLFHSRHRLGRHADPYGGGYPFAGRFDPLPVLRAPVAGDIVPLPRPDLETLSRTDPPFSQVLEARASIRQPGTQPLTVGQLGEFLYRSARVKALDESHGVSLRPYPSGGALHPLEIYPVAARCAGLDAGLYHYDSGKHVLRRIPAHEQLLEALVGDASASAGLAEPPDVLLVIAARFQRTQQKYQSVAYSLILKDVGGLMQTMYLVATAMGLAPCALGGGHSDHFAKAAGLNYYEEASVGEFILSSKAGDASTDS
jgi:SagB-type dehydrogenase family enzyme